MNTLLFAELCGKENKEEFNQTQQSSSILTNYMILKTLLLRI